MSDNDKIIDMARALGRAIQADERYQVIKKIREENDADADLQDAIGRFNLVRMQLNEEASKDNADQSKVMELNLEMRGVYGEIMRHEGMIKYEEVKDGIESLYNYVSAIVAAAFNGGDPDTVEEPVACCDGDCDGGCEGCH